MSTPHLILVGILAAIAGGWVWIKLCDSIFGRADYGDDTLRVIAYLLLVLFLILYISGL